MERITTLETEGRNVNVTGRDWTLEIEYNTQRWLKRAESGRFCSDVVASWHTVKLVLLTVSHAQRDRSKARGTQRTDLVCVMA